MAGSTSQLLEHYRASDVPWPEELESIERMLDLVRTEPRCFDRNLEGRHFTASAWIFNRDRTAFLLTHHRKLNIWVQLGGHADGDGDLLRVALREAHEESGIEGIEPDRLSIIDVDIHDIPANAIEPAHQHYDVRFVLRAPVQSHFRVSEESHDLAWVRRGDLLRYTDERSVHRMAEKLNCLTDAPRLPTQLSPSRPSQ